MMRSVGSCPVNKSKVVLVPASAALPDGHICMLVCVYSSVLLSLAYHLGRVAQVLSTACISPLSMG